MVIKLMSMRIKIIPGKKTVAHDTRVMYTKLIISSEEVTIRGFFFNTDGGMSGLKRCSHPVVNMAYTCTHCVIHTKLY